MKPTIANRLQQKCLVIRKTVASISLLSFSLAQAAEVTFSTYVATGNTDTSWVITTPGVASINFGGNDVASFGGVSWEGTRTNGHFELETYAAIGGYAVYHSEPGVAWANLAQNTFYPTDSTLNVLHDGTWRPSAGQIDIAGLVVGREYTAKLIFADSRAGSSGRQMTVSATGSNTGSSSATQYAYTDGRYLVVTATWTADSSSMTLIPQVSGGGGTQINAVQILQSPLAAGSELTWDNGASTGVWNTSDLNWTGSAWTNSVTNHAQFGVTGAGPITVTGQITAGNLTFNAPGYSLNGGTLVLESSIITANEPVSIGSSLSGTTGLTKAGAAALTLGGAVNYSGLTTVSAGSLTYNQGATLSALTIDSGASVVAAANDAPLTVNGNLTLNNGATLSATGTPNAILGNVYLPDLGQQVVVTGDSTSTISAQLHLRELRTFNVADGGASTDLLISGRVNHIPGQAWAAVVKSGAGTLELSNPTNSQGGNFLNAGTLTFANNALGNPGGPWPLAQFNGNATLRWATGNTQDISSGGELLVADGVTATLDTNGNDVTLASPIATAAAASGSVVKAGEGTLTLGGINTFTGNLTVAAGSLVLADNAQLRFRVTDASANQITGAGSLTLDGDFAIDTSAVSGTTAGSWTLVDVTTLPTPTFGSTFSVVGFSDSDNDGVWNTTDSRGAWAFSESTGVLTFTPGVSDYDAWKTANNVSGGENDDDDQDGLSNFQEYAFGLSPTSAASGSPITAPLNQTNGTFRFTRRDPAKAALTYSVWVSTDLTTWTETTFTLTSISLANDVETVEVTIPAALLTNSKLFVQVRAQ